MKKVSFNVQKWTVRAVVAVGALLGISACSHTKKVVEDGNENMPPIHNLKYGPLVKNRLNREVKIVKRIGEDGEVQYDTIVSPETMKTPQLKPFVVEDE